ncbi:methyltransferase domain-containing protein [Cardiosporidium cionae]|uniref:Ribosomal RNA-processing protein 8 n=1 Tax=Cardiosporidium cionae TaxID=476202 RepID=A0ABQ7JGE2_9APIC|nr:methyltransferase domain-containing protein [Cardiosporidium cionae]|eukprot:KAF8823074.1 methyltransferase domain-containing protein [Cardiosporidium cionae]
MLSKQFSRRKNLVDRRSTPRINSKNSQDVAAISNDGHSLHQITLSMSSMNRQKRLQGSRFRDLNEWLYSNSGEIAFKLFQDKPQLFETYHVGYQKQVLQWPINPLDVIIEWITKCSPHWSIGDFGCGEARLAATFPNRQIFSFDIVASNPRVTACDISKIPLENESLHVVIFCLSLMGTNWPCYITEAHRCLKSRGMLLIAEVTSRIADIKKFAHSIESVGFMLKKKRDLKSFFTLLILQKRTIVRQDQHALQKENSSLSQAPKNKRKRTFNHELPEKSAKIDCSLLKPCLYKKR